MILNWVLSFSYGLTMEILRAGNTTGIFSQKYYRLCNFNQRRHHVWYYMVTTPGKTVQCPLEGSGIAIYMNSVHKYYIYFCVMQLQNGRLDPLGFNLHHNRRRKKEDLGSIRVKKVRLHSSRGNHRVFQIYKSDCIYPTESKIFFNQEDQEYTNIKVVLEQRVHILKYFSKAYGELCCVVKDNKSEEVLTGSQKNMLIQTIQYL